MSRVYHPRIQIQVIEDVESQNLATFHERIDVNFKALYGYIGGILDLSGKCQRIFGTLSAPQTRITNVIEQDVASSILPGLTQLSRDTDSQMKKMCDISDEKMMIAELESIKQLNFQQSTDMQAPEIPEILVTFANGEADKMEFVQVPLEEASTEDISIPRLHALIIGINKYSSGAIPNLHGAVADANAVETFLQDSITYPSPRITKLVNREASRDKIIQAFQNLACDARKGDPVLIFYAGHATEVENDDKQPIQAIIPCDVNIDDEDDNVNRRVIHPIPDTTLGALIADLSEKIGDNITVIFDSCFSGSGTRDGHAARENDADPAYPARFVDLGGYRMPDDLDGAMVSALSAGVRQAAVQKEGPSSSTHVLLAACKSTEFAREHNRRGQFTTALLKLLEFTPYDELTYAELLPRLDPLKYQHPQCEGDNVHRHFFGGKARSLLHCYRVQYKEGEFTLNVGELSGIFQGTAFDIYPDRTSAACLSQLIGTAIAISVSPFTTILQVQFHYLSFTSQLPKGAVALQTKAGVMKKPASKLRVALNGQHHDISSAIAKWRDNPNNICFETAALEDIDPCLELSYCLPGPSLSMDVLDWRAVEHGLQNTRHSVSASPEKVLAILRAAAHFYYYLDLQPEAKYESRELNDELNDIQKYIAIDLNKLEGPKNSRRPVGDNLYSNGMIDLVINQWQNSPYGIKLTNKTSRNLYVYAFYFDFTEFSILKLYGRRAGQDHLEPDLPAATNNTLSIGFGSGGVRPIGFAIPENQDVDVGYIKIFFSTEPIDLEHVERAGSAFELVETKGSAFDDDFTPRAVHHWDEPSVKAWGTIEIPVKLSRQ